jgi:hypothetical protein
MLRADVCERDLTEHLADGPLAATDSDTVTQA